MGKTWVWMVLALTLAAGTAACGASGGNAATPAHYPSSAASSAAASTAAARTVAHADSVVDSLPRYQPSKVISEAAGHIQLTSTDPVGKVASFYRNTLKSRGWRILADGKNVGSTDITAMLGTTGV